MADIRFHDISYAQGQYDMDADPNPIIFMKMSGYYYGSKTPYYDVQAARNYQNAVRLGKFKGLYHFAGGADPVEEADFFVGACSPLADGDLMILDYELTAEMDPPADPNAWCLAFIERVKERTGKYPLFYTYFAMLQQYGFTEVLKRSGLWIAHYGIPPEQDIPECPPYIIHQYQGSPLDTNACFVELDVLRKYAYQTNQPQPAPPVPEPTPAPTPVQNPGTNIDGVIPPTPKPDPVPTPEPEPEIELPVKEPNKENNMQGFFEQIPTMFKAVAAFCALLVPFLAAIATGLSDGSLSGSEWQAIWAAGAALVGGTYAVWRARNKKEQ